MPFQFLFWLHLSYGPKNLTQDPEATTPFGEALRLQPGGKCLINCRVPYYVSRPDWDGDDDDDGGGDDDDVLHVLVVIWLVARSFQVT